MIAVDRELEYQMQINQLYVNDHGLVDKHQQFHSICLPCSANAPAILMTNNDPAKPRGLKNTYQKISSNTLFSLFIIPNRIFNRSIICNN